jgi:ligand-binding SRPBCC domain-containing protein
MPIYKHTSFYPYPVEDLYDFHDKPGAMKKLVMPGTFAQILRDDRLNLQEGELEFRLWFGPLPQHWIVRHETGPNTHSFVDRMISGPLASWVHEHKMEAAPGGSRLTDQVSYKHHIGLRGLVYRLFFNPLTLKILFTYRHWITKKSLESEK